MDITDRWELKKFYDREQIELENAYRHAMDKEDVMSTRDLTFTEKLDLGCEEVYHLLECGHKDAFEKVASKLYVNIKRLRDCYEEQYGKPELQDRELVKIKEEPLLPREILRLPELKYIHSARKKQVITQWEYKMVLDSYDKKTLSIKQWDALKPIALSLRVYQLEGG